MGSELAQVQSSTPKGSGGQRKPEHREGTGVSLEFPAEAELRGGSPTLWEAQCLRQVRTSC